VAETSATGRIGLVVLGSIASGLLVGLLLVLVVFAGGPEHQITGSALAALGAGFLLLAAVSTRYTDQPQRWALGPAAGFGVLGLVLLGSSPSGHTLGLMGWAWPVLLLALVGWSFRGARHALHNRSRRALLYPALFVLLLVAAGGFVETVAEATSSNPPLGGQTYLVNGHRLYLKCAGTGSPTVVLFNGQGERTPTWSLIQSRVSFTTRVCAFDRAGEGWSGGSPGHQDGAQLASDVHGLLHAAHIGEPYVLAGHSTGGIYALLYVAHYPTQVAGVALIDSATPYQFDLPDYPGFYSLWRRGSALFPTLARFGLARPTLGTGFTSLPAREARAARAFAASPRELSADRADFARLSQLFEEAKSVKSLGVRPLAVVSATVGQQRGWSAAQERLVKMSRNGFQRPVTGATHQALLSDPRFSQITSGAIARVVEFTRQARR
jgi:pimeloyl-ACP methyl ester carboxylesterase